MTDTTMFRKIPQSFSWKGKTFSQISAAIQMNQNTVILTSNNLNHSRPVKHYRRELATTPLTSPTVQRSAIRIDHLNQPNGYIITSVSDSQANGLVNTLDIGYENNTTQHPGTCSSFSTTDGLCLTQDANARRRVRSSGMIQKSKTYYTTNNQYLESRNRKFTQNQYNYNYSRNTVGKPGDPVTMENIYKPLMNCFDVSGCSRIVYYKPSNYQFAQQGGVSASSLITRIKYNAISTNTMKYRTSFGDSVANAMAYGVSDKIYTDKDKLGYSNTCTPIIGKDGTISSTQCYRSRR